MSHLLPNVYDFNKDYIYFLMKINKNIIFFMCDGVDKNVNITK